MHVTLPKVILVATDFSACGKNAVHYAVLLAKKLEARVYVVHAWQLPVIDWEAGIALPEELFTQIETRQKAGFEEAMAEARKELPSVEGQLLQGDARDVIVRKASDVSADLIVVGTRGRRGLARVLLGSVAEHVVRHASCPVLTIGLQDTNGIETRVQ